MPNNIKKKNKILIIDDNDDNSTCSTLDSSFHSDDFIEPKQENRNEVKNDETLIVDDYDNDDETLIVDDYEKDDELNSERKEILEMNFDLDDPIDKKAFYLLFNSENKNTTTTKNMIDDGLQFLKRLKPSPYNDLEIDSNKKAKIETALDRKIQKLEKEILEYNKKFQPLNKENTRDRIILMDIPLSTKAFILNRFDQEITKSSGSDYTKQMNWVKNLLSIPFGKYKQLPVNLKSKKKDIQQFLKKVQNSMDLAVWGHKKTKDEIIDFVGKIISNPNATGQILALNGEKGVGKTLLIKKGIAEALNRPFYQINFGGLNDPSVLVGHDMTYVGAKYGKLVQILIQAQCMNPIIYLDEIDKMGTGETSKSREIFGILTHLLDEEQNNEFEDLYFQGIKLDLSRILFVISFNKLEQVDNIVSDRMKIISVDNPKIQDKLIIAQNYMLPRILDSFGMKTSDIVISDDLLKYIIEYKTIKEDGVRKFKKNLETIVQKINTLRILKGCKDNYLNLKFFVPIIKFPIIITKLNIDTILDSTENNDFSNIYS